MRIHVPECLAVPLLRVRRVCDSIDEAIVYAVHA